MRLNPKDGESVRGRGTVLQSIGLHRQMKRREDPDADFESAIADFTRAIEINKGDELAWELRGRTHLNRATWFLMQKKKEKVLGLFRACLHDVDMALKLNPKFGRAFFTRGTLRFRNSQWDPAEADFQSAKTASPALGRRCDGWLREIERRRKK